MPLNLGLDELDLARFTNLMTAITDISKGEIVALQASRRSEHLHDTRLTEEELATYKDEVAEAIKTIFCITVIFDCARVYLPCIINDGRYDNETHRRHQAILDVVNADPSHFDRSLKIAKPELAKFLTDNEIETCLRFIHFVTTYAKDKKFLVFAQNYFTAIANAATDYNNKLKKATRPAISFTEYVELMLTGPVKPIVVGGAPIAYGVTDAAIAAKKHLYCGGKTTTPFKSNLLSFEIESPPHSSPTPAATHPTSPTTSFSFSDCMRKAWDSTAALFSLSA